MGRAFSRRRLLSTTAACLATAWGASGRVHGAQPADAGGFDPERHGYGFRNWTPETQYFDAPPDPTMAAVVEEILTTWRGRADDVLGLDTSQLSRRTAEIIAVPLRLAIAQRAGTNGHCYGMALTAQQYFEQPSTIPVDRPVASEIELPTVPVEEPRAPVYEAIHRTQADQFLRFRSWLARRAMLTPEWIDLASVLRDVEAVIDQLGTATLLVFDRRLFGHQVLAYGYHEEGDRVRVPVYDPNRPATAYRHDRPELRFTRSGGSVRMAPYGRYDHLLFNRYDRIERATDRDQATPLQHLTVDRPTLRQSLFPLVVVLSDTADVSLTLLSPAGESLDRLRATFMDRSRGDHARIRTMYGAEPGTYRVDVYGSKTTDYELTARAADAEGVIVDETRSGVIEAGEVHAFDLTLPADGEGSLARANREWRRQVLVGGGAAAGGVALGALGHRVLQRRRTG